jgi:predicted dithiol-disulfide oxidoreductase (DUF899 family)
MTSHRTGTREEMQAESKKLRERQHELSRQLDELTRERRELPWVKVEKSYTLDTEDGPKTLEEMFDGRSQLIVYHMMFGPGWKAACPGCTHLVDHIDPTLPHLNARDVTVKVVSHAPIDKLKAYKKRMGWKVPVASSYNRDFNDDFGASFDKEQSDEIAKVVLPQFGSDEAIAKAAASCGIDVREYVTTEAPGLDVFVREGGAIYHTYTSVPDGDDIDIGYHQYLDRAPKEWTGGTIPYQRSDEYEKAQQLT